MERASRGPRRPGGRWRRTAVLLAAAILGGGCAGLEPAADAPGGEAASFGAPLRPRGHGPAPYFLNRQAREIERSLGL